MDKQKALYRDVNKSVYGDIMVQVQLRLAEGTVKDIDEWIEEGKFKNRSDAIRSIIDFYEEREKTIAFYKMLMKESKEAEENPELLIPIEEVE